MRDITTTWRGSCAASIRFTISKVLMSYQYISSLCYCEIHLRRFIRWYCTFIYNKYVNLLCFIFPSSQNSAYLTNNHHKTVLVTKISNQFLLWYLQRPFFSVDTEYTTFSKASTVQMQKTKKMPTRSKHLKTGLYRGSANFVRYYFNRKVLLYNVYPINNPYSYGELSIFVPFF